MLAPGINVTKDEDHDESDGFDEANDEVALESHRPGIKKNNLDIEDDKEQGNEVVAKVELDPGVALGLDAALIGVHLYRVGQLRPAVDLAKEHRRGKRERGKHEGEQEENCRAAEFV